MRRLIPCVALAASLACTTRTISTTTDIVPSASGLAVIPAGSGWLGDPRIGLARDAALVAALADVSPARIRTTDSALVSFGTRNTFSDTLSSTRGIGAARRWLFAQLQQASRDCGGCLRVEYDAAVIAVARHPQRASANIVNVLGILPGRDTNRVIVMGGHYDSCVCSVPPNGGVDSTSTAPGADDDGSGTSAVVELARVFSKRYPKGLDATVIFVLHAAEEQGLLGATHLAQRLKAEGKQVIAGMTDDIVGNVVAEDGTVDSTSVRIFATDPDSSGSRELGRYVWGPRRALSSRIRGRARLSARPDWPRRRSHAVHPGGLARTSLYGAARELQAPASPDRRPGTRELRLHRPGGSPQRGHRRRRSPPRLPRPIPSSRARENAASGGQAWSLRWTPVAGATRYEVLVRRTTSPSWDRVIPVSGGLTHQLDFQLDDGWAAVRAVGANGHRSLARAAGPAPRPAVTAPARP